MRRQFIEIKMSRCRLFLTEHELQNLLSLNPLLWQEGIRRGKAIQRSQAARERSNKTQVRRVPPFEN